MTSKRAKSIKASAPHTDHLYPMLRDDPEFAVEYLKACFDDEDPATFNVALRHVAAARSRSMADLARKVGMARPALYRALSETGNPELTTAKAVLKAVGISVHFTLEQDAG
jgi:probable addiction module antidote protein